MCGSVTGWADNAVTNRARVAGDGEIIQQLMTCCNAREVQMAVGRDNQINQAFELGDCEMQRQTYRPRRRPLKATE